MTAADLIHDVTFRAFIRTWEEDKTGKCPFELVDLLLDYGLEVQAEAARWCATEPEREGFNRPNSGIRPWDTDSGYCWWFHRVQQFPESIPHTVWMRIVDGKHKPESRAYIPYPDFLSAAVALLDNWIVGAEVELEAAENV